MLNKPDLLRGTNWATLKKPFLRVAQLVQKKNPAFMEPEGSISSSPESAIGQWLEPAASHGFNNGTVYQFPVGAFWLFS
jgi:hypothetical protein